MSAFKKDDKSSPSNYRPISLLSCIGKVMERAVYKYTYNFIFEHSLLYAYQSGFIRGHSTVYQLLEMYHRVCQNLDERLSTILIFCDISKAFDRVCHEGLIKKLKSYGISGLLLSSFLKAGITRAIFHVDGNMPFCNEKLKIIAKGIQIVSEVLLGKSVEHIFLFYFIC
jgi:hypothetical protein